MKIQSTKNISTLAEVRLKKTMIRKQLNKKSKKISLKTASLRQKVNPQTLFTELLGKFGVENSLLNMLPLLMKYRQQIQETGIPEKISGALKNKKTLKYILLSASAGFFGYLFVNELKKVKKNKNK